MATSRLGGTLCPLASTHSKALSNSVLPSYVHFTAAPCHFEPRPFRTRPRFVAKRALVSMGLKIVETFDGSFQLKPECDQKLQSLLSSEAFCKQVAGQTESWNGSCEFTGKLFQPVPWSPATQYGMPQEFEKYLHDKENYIIINVPPNFMFQAKIFHPSRLCAIFRKV